MSHAHKPRSAFAGRPLALRRRVLAVLERADRLTAAEIAGFAYQPVGWPICRDRPPPCSNSQVTTVRGVLRGLTKRGKVVVLHRDRHRRRVFGLEITRRELDAVLATMTATSGWIDT